MSLSDLSDLQSPGVNPVERLCDVVEQLIDSMDVQQTDLQRSCDAVMSTPSGISEETFQHCVESDSNEEPGAGLVLCSVTHRVGTLNTEYYTALLCISTDPVYLQIDCFNQNIPTHMYSCYWQ